MIQRRSDNDSLVTRLEERLQAALPPLFRKLRGPVVQALVHRAVGCWRQGADVTAANCLYALRAALAGLGRELEELEQQADAFARDFAQAPDDGARRKVLLRHLRETVPSRLARWQDVRALRRYLGYDALRERLERRRRVLLVQEELALRCIRGLVGPRTEAELPATAVFCLQRALSSPRPQAQLAALEAVAAALRQSPRALDADAQAIARLLELLDRPTSGPWLSAAAFSALLHCERALALERLRQRIDAAAGGNGHPRDFLFRRQALEVCAAALDEGALLPVLEDASARDPSEWVRLGACELLESLPHRSLLLRRLAGLRDGAREPSPKVRAGALLAAARVCAARSAGWVEAAEVLVDALETEQEPLPLRAACDQLALGADTFSDPSVAGAREKLRQVLRALVARPGLEGAVLESAAAAAQALEGAFDVGRRGWRRYLHEQLARIRPGGRLQLRVSPPPPGLPPLPDDDGWLGSLLAELARDDFGVYARRRGVHLELRRGERQERKAWRVLNELRRPAPNKRQGHVHTVGRSFGGELRAHPARLDEVTATSVPGERVHVPEEGGWGRHLPLVDDLLELPLDGRELRLFSSHGITTVTPPASLSRRIKNRLALTTGYARLAGMRLSSLRGKEARERRRYVEELRGTLGVEVKFAPYQKEQCPPPRLASLFGEPGKDGALHASLLAEGTLLAQALDVIVEQNDYFFGTRGNGVTALAVFTATLFSFFLADAWRKRRTVRRARAALPLSIGGWGTRGKSGTERLKAALFSGLGFEVFAKTTGSEAMFVHTAPTGVPSEFFIYRPYDKATIWEQRDMADLAARLGTEVFLWECMALQPDFVELLQNDWMRDDYATLTNAFPDHEDIQGPAGVNVAQVISRFMPEGRTLLTTEDHFLPVFRESARRKGTTLLHSPWWDAELIPEELLALFPYREHPRNMALVASLAEQLGIPRTQALGLMAEHVQPEIGVLKVFPKIRARGRLLTFINGHSANERTGFLNNWSRCGLDQVDPGRAPERAVVTVINNRWDRVARSEVFARLLVEDAPADRHVLIGTNLEGLTRYLRTALEQYTARLEVVTAEDLEDSAGRARALERLERQLLRLKIPPPSPGIFLDRLQRSAFAAGLDLKLGPELGTLLAGALTSDGELQVAQVRRELGHTVLPLLQRALVPAGQEQDGALPEVIAPATKDEVCEHALFLLARMVVHGRLRRLMPHGPGNDAARRLATFHRQLGAAYRELFLEQLIPVHDAHATGDQLVDACSRAVAPGLEVSVMGAQNIKGTGLDWVYRWMAVDRVHAALGALEGGTEAERRRALELLETFEDSGVADAALAAAHLSRLALRAGGAEEGARLAQLAQRYRAIHEVKLAALGTSRSGSAAERLVRGVEKVFDYLDSVRRRSLADQLVDDLVHGRVSHARAAIETRRLHERQKGGWLWSKLGGKAGARGAEAASPARPELPPLAPSFEEALRTPHDVTLKVPGQQPPAREREEGARGAGLPESPDSQRDS